MSKATELLTALLNEQQIEDFAPNSRMEAYLKNCCLACGCDGLPEPITEADKLLYALAEKLAGGTPGGGGGGSTDEGWIGDGNTHIWITLNEGRTSPMLGVCPSGTVTVDWGDGTAPDTLTGASTSTVKWTPTHNYAKPGDYVITLSADRTMGLNGNSQFSQRSCILRHSSGSDDRNRTYQSNIKKMEIGDGVTSMGQYAFSNCYALASVVIPDSVTSIGQYAFSNCYALASVVIPDSVTSIGQNSFEYCYALASVVIPDSVTSIGNGAFDSCYGIRHYDFTKHTSVPTLAATNAFSGIAADCEIRVPAALYDEWIAATNWATYANYIKAV